MTKAIDIADDSTVLPPLHCCENCRFWQEFEPDPSGGRTGLCVAQAPVLVGFGEDYLPSFAQPITGVYSTCGLWGRIEEIELESGRVAQGSHRWIFPAGEQREGDEGGERDESEAS